MKSNFISMSTWKLYGFVFLHRVSFPLPCSIIIIAEMAVILRGLATSNEGEIYGL